MKVRTIYLSHRLDLLDVIEDNSHPLVAEIQKLLAAHGLYLNSITGNFDNITRLALAQFQKNNHLPISGKADPVTYCLLREGSTLADVDPVPYTSRASYSQPRANILITKSTRQLTLFNGKTSVRQYPVAIGKSHTPTPEGNFAIATKIHRPGGVLGTRWMGLNYGSYGIHGTNAPWLIGQMVSHGCIRMHNANVEELFELVRVGTPVIIRN